MKKIDRMIHYCIGEKLDGSRVGCDIIYEGRKIRIRVNDSLLRRNEHTLFHSDDPETEFMIQFGIKIIEIKLGQDVGDMYERMSEFNAKIRLEKNILSDGDLGIINKNT